jgi:hypothetical protein
VPLHGGLYSSDEADGGESGEANVTSEESEKLQEGADGCRHRRRSEAAWQHSAGKEREGRSVVEADGGRAEGGRRPLYLSDGCVDLAVGRNHGGRQARPAQRAAATAAAAAQARPRHGLAHPGS